MCPFGFGCGCGSRSRSDDSRKEVVREVVREVVMIPCRYCGALFQQLQLFVPIVAQKEPPNMFLNSLIRDVC